MIWFDNQFMAFRLLYDETQLRYNACEVSGTSSGSTRPLPDVKTMRTKQGQRIGSTTGAQKGCGEPHKSLREELIDNLILNSSSRIALRTLPWTLMQERKATCKISNHYMLFKAYRYLNRLQVSVNKTHFDH